jgi:membrane protease YdiL (CAAX protease family)
VSRGRTEWWDKSHPTKVTLSIYSPPNPLDYEPPQHRRRGVPVGTAIAWLIIALCVTAMLTRIEWGPRLRGNSTATKPPAIEPTTAAQLTKYKSTQLQLAARYAVGIRSLLPADQSKTFSTDLVKQLEQTATAGGTLEELRIIPVIGELQGKDAALDALDRFDVNHPHDPPYGLASEASRLREIYETPPDRRDPNNADALIAHHGWFGRLAVANGLPKDDPRRAAAIDPALRTVAAFAGVTIGGLGALVTGIVLAILAVVRFSKGRFPRAYRPTADPALAGPFVEAFAVYLVSFIALSVGLALLFPRAVFWPSFAATVVIPLAIAWLRLRRVPWPEIVGGLGWHARGRGVGGVFREIGAGLVGYLAGLPVLAVGLITTFVLVNVTRATPSHPVQDMPMEALADRLQIFLLAAVWAPVVEETMFRGALFHHLRGRFGWWVSTIVVSVVFAVIHPQGWTTVPALAAVAFVLAGIREWRASIIGPMTAHAIHNGTLILVLMAATS